MCISTGRIIRLVQKSLVRTIEQQFPNKRIEFLVGMLADKDVEAVLRIFERVGRKFTFVDFDNDRAMDAQQILAISNAEETEIVQDCIPMLHRQMSEGTVRIVTGSLYLLSEIRKQLIVR